MTMSRLLRTSTAKSGGLLMGPRGRKAIPKDGPLAFPRAGFYNLAQASSKAAGHMSRCCITPSRLGVRQPDKRESGCRNRMPSSYCGFFTRPFPQAASNSLVKPANLIILVSPLLRTLRKLRFPSSRIPVAITKRRKRSPSLSTLS